ncbi:hypothetical protein EX30DRAFT_380390 [Ascodesmis nigricans]|uniref:Uncharacterized protein n=1 Tax=Ascodesmis nigricans TaxID=341454 RepID=A0A4S2MTJ2_9PEZI|nr:hypothetical protein EX30DRAFT_380390 [Ascodesmis nigricans]
MPTPNPTQHRNLQPSRTTKLPSHPPAIPSTSTPLPSHPPSTPAPTPSPLPTTPRKPYPCRYLPTSTNNNVPHTTLPALPRVRKPSIPFPPITPLRTPTRSAVRSVVVGTPETPRTSLGRMQEWRMGAPRGVGGKGFQGMGGLGDGDGLGDVEMVDVDDVVGGMRGVEGKQEVEKENEEMDWMMEVEDT